MQQVSSLPRMAPEPVLFARVKLTMAADPAVEHPVIAQANIDLNGRLIGAQAAGQTMREAVGHACDRLRIRLGRAAQNWAAIRGGQPAGEPGEWRLAHETPDEPAADAELVDYDFHRFTEKSTGEDSVIYRAGDGYRLALAHPRQPHVPPRLRPLRPHRTRRLSPGARRLMTV